MSVDELVILAGLRDAIEKFSDAIEKKLKPAENILKKVKEIIIVVEMALKE